MRFLLFFPAFLLAAHIFVLHRIDDFRYPSTNTSTKDLKRYFDYLKTHNYKVVKLSTLINMIKSGKDTSQVVVFTIDDSYKSFYKNGLPLFKKYNYPFTLFVYVRASKEKWGDFMSFDELKEVQKFGELGIHSYAHPHLAKLSDNEIREDTLKAIDVFRRYMGYVPKMYAYPYGEYDERVKGIIKKYFPYIANQNIGVVDETTSLDDMDRFALVGKSNFLKDLKYKRLHLKYLKIIHSKDKIFKIFGESDLPYVDIYITGWGWKRVKVKDNRFVLTPNFKLKKYRTRIIISYNYKIISKLILKEE